MLSLKRFPGLDPDWRLRQGWLMRDAAAESAAPVA